MFLSQDVAALDTDDCLALFTFYYERKTPRIGFDKSAESCDWHHNFDTNWSKLKKNTATGFTACGVTTCSVWPVVFVPDIYRCGRWCCRQKAGLAAIHQYAALTACRD